MAARQGRLACWREPEGEDVSAFLAEFAPEGTLSLAYEQSVARGDAVADRLRREADRVAQKAELLAQLTRHRATHAELDRDRRSLDECQARIQGDWKTLVGPLAIDAESKTPAELRAWLRQREDVVQLFQKADEARQSFTPLEQTYDAKRAALSRALDEFGEAFATKNSDLAELLEHSESVIKRYDDLSHHGRRWKPSSPPPGLSVPLVRPRGRQRRQN